MSSTSVTSALLFQVRTRVGVQGTASGVHCNVYQGRFSRRAAERSRSLPSRLHRRPGSLGARTRSKDVRVFEGLVIGAVFTEKVTATGKVERHAWEQLREEACLPMSRRFEHVLVWALDRWSRERSFVKAIGSVEESRSSGSSSTVSRSLSWILEKKVCPIWQGISCVGSFRQSPPSRPYVGPNKRSWPCGRSRKGDEPQRADGSLEDPRRLRLSSSRRSERLHGEGYNWREVALRLHIKATCARNGSRPTSGVQTRRPKSPA